MQTTKQMVRSGMRNRKKIDDKLSQSCTPKEKDASSHLLFLISIGRTTHVTRNMCYLGGEKTYHYVYVLCK